MNNHKTSGFTLLEMAVVLAILSSVIAGVLSLGNAKHEQNKHKLTAHRLNVMEQRLAYLASEADIIPCPAIINAAIGSADFGAETDCTIATVAGVTSRGGASLSSEEVRIGAVPIRALNLPDVYMFDGWNNRFIYIMTAQMADAGTGVSGHTTANTDNVILIRDKNGNQIPENTADTVIAYAIVSHGKDGEGAYNKAGTVQESCDFSNLDGENCDYNAGDNDATFRDTAIVDSVVSTDYYDDIMRWKLSRYLEKY